jgi:hypothetical protein
MDAATDSNRTEADNSPKAITLMLGAVGIWILIIGFFFWRLSVIHDIDQQARVEIFQSCESQAGFAYLVDDEKRAICVEKNAIIFQAPIIR